MGSSYADAELLSAILELHRNSALFAANITDDIAALSTLMADDSRQAMASVDAFVEALREITTAASGSGDIVRGLETVVISSRRLVERLDGIRSGVGGQFGLIGSLSGLAQATGARSKDLDAMLEEFALSDGAALTLPDSARRTVFRKRRSTLS